jgi:hypothetical protein
MRNMLHVAGPVAGGGGRTSRAEGCSDLAGNIGGSRTNRKCSSGREGPNGPRSVPCESASGGTFGSQAVQVSADASRMTEAATCSSHASSSAPPFESSPGWLGRLPVITLQRRWSRWFMPSGPFHNYGDAPRASRRPPSKAGGGSIPGVCDRRATPRGGMHRRPNASVIMKRAT